MAKADSNVRLSDACRELGNAMFSLKDMACVLELIARDTVLRNDDADVLKKAYPDRDHKCMNDFKFLMLSKDQANAIDYAISHTHDMISKMHERYLERIEA